LVIARDDQFHHVFMLRLEDDGEYRIVGEIVLSEDADLKWEDGWLTFLAYTYKYGSVKIMSRLVTVIHGKPSWATLKFEWSESRIIGECYDD
jgi:hypothetical protein